MAIYTEWDVHLIDHTWADDGFGTMVYVEDLGLWRFNVNQINIIEH